MADRLWRAQVSIPLDSGIPEDAIVNTFHFDDDDDPVAAPDDTRDFIMSLLTAFYQDIDGVMFGQNVGAEATVKLYDMADALPRQPLYTETIALAPLASGIDLTLPNEVALCLSFAAAGASGVNPQRRRGRVFLGPVHYAASSMVGSQCRPLAAVRDAVAAAAETMADGYEHPASPGYRCRWSIYSPTTDATSSLADSFNDVISGWVDDAFDTQRRRGAAPTTRSLF